MELDNNNHSVFKLYYHLILVVKYRRNVFDEEICEFAKKKFIDVSQKYNITLEEFNHDQDHIQVLFTAKPNTELSKFINAYKSSTSRMIKKNYPKVKSKLWKSSFWTKSYCLITTGGISTEVIKRYIETQGDNKR
jgi:putative transposase